MIRLVDAPTARTAITYSSCLTEIVEPRAMRANIGMELMPTARMTFVVPTPSAAMIATASRKVGRASSTSMQRMMSGIRPAAPEAGDDAERCPRHQREHDGPERHQQRDARSPDQATEHIAPQFIRPQWVRDGRRQELIAEGERIGLYGEMRGASSAMSRKRLIITSPISAARLRRNDRQTGEVATRCRKPARGSAATGVPAAAIGLGTANHSESSGPAGHRRCPR